MINDSTSDDGTKDRMHLLSLRLSYSSKCRRGDCRSRQSILILYFYIISFVNFESEYNI